MAGACAQLFGCAAEVTGADLEAEPGESREVEDLQEPIVLGTYVGFKKGLARITLPAGGSGHCTASLVGANWGISAAHCFPWNGGNRHDNFSMTVNYYDPDEQRRRVVGEGSLEVWAIDTYDGPGSHDYVDDLAIFYSQQPWSGTDSSDYLRINGGTQSGSVNHLGALEFFGSGLVNEQGDGGGVLMKRRVRLTGSNKHAMWDEEDGHPVCLGDSGGPTIGTNNGFPIVAGVLATIQTLHDGDNCTRVGGTQWSARTNSRTAWIEQKMNARGTSCAKTSHYMKCFF